MMKCNTNGCSGEGGFPCVGFCPECWNKLPSSAQRDVIEARGRGPREEAEAIQRAKARLRKGAV